MNVAKSEVVGDMFDPGDWTEEELKKKFPTRYEEMVEWRRKNVLSDPEYYHATQDEIAELIQHVGYTQEACGYEK